MTKSNNFFSTTFITCIVMAMTFAVLTILSFSEVSNLAAMHDLNNKQHGCTISLPLSINIHFKSINGHRKHLLLKISPQDWRKNMVSLGIFTLISTLFLVLAAVPTTASSSKLSPNYYDHACPKALPAIKRVVEAAVNKERRMGASLLRLHFHDCFVHVLH